MTKPNNYEALYRQALLIRRVEEEIIRLYPSDKVQSPVHLSIGQEAVAVGVCSLLKPEDRMFSTYRSHAFYLAKGGDLNAMMAELFGKVDGCCGGKGGSMHLAYPKVGFMGTSAVVASGIPNAVGNAYANQILGKSDLTVSVFGDGATEEGVYHESLNFASLHKLPIIFICENNQFAVHTRLESRQSYAIREHVSSYGIDTFHIEDGYDFCTVQTQFVNILADYHDDPRPVFIEIDTCRYMEHVGPGEDFYGGYRDQREHIEWRNSDPLLTDQQTYNALLAEVNKQIDESVAFAEASPFPTITDLYQDVY
ncbi:thiamine pyrophosphate-dependent dehydrogenase E1 component subunit alpha [Amphritea sp.]|uniref:thiamine pyrophosphate-dependent dehydrogenase E1 component subunit alpha n=1 Tax=Amphritea sp. TaxID=1872502 RepID=UPI003A8F49A2